MSRFQRKLERNYTKLESEADTLLDRIKASRWTLLMLIGLGLLILAAILI